MNSSTLLLSAVRIVGFNVVLAVDESNDVFANTTALSGFLGIESDALTLVQAPPPIVSQPSPPPP